MKSESTLEILATGEGELNTTGLLMGHCVTTIDQWAAIGRRLCECASSVPWWIGDWIVWGREQFGKRKEDGTFAVSPAYDLAVKETKYDRRTLENFASISRAIHPTSRCIGLTWSHHREVAPLQQSEQVRWLDAALVNHWSVSELRCAIRTASAIHIDDEPNPNAFAWAKAADEVERYLIRELREKPIEQWSETRRIAVEAKLKPIADVYQKLYQME